ncbi:hypothetical protein N7453_002006, partial [Penicillium expansum]
HQSPTPEQNAGRLLLPVMIVEQGKFDATGYNQCVGPAARGPTRDSNVSIQGS